jgi:hypothetical protein
MQPNQTPINLPEKQMDVADSRCAPWKGGIASSVTHFLQFAAPSAAQ